LIAAQEMEDKCHNLEVAVNVLQDGCDESSNVTLQPKSHLFSYKKVRVDSLKPGGSVHWPLWMVQLTMEQLVHGTPPAAIIPNIASQAMITTPGVEIESLPKIRWVQNCRSALRIVGETLTAYRLAQAGVSKFRSVQQQDTAVPLPPQLLLIHLLL
jgi:hypothetical protein